MWRVTVLAPFLVVVVVTCFLISCEAFMARRSLGAATCLSTSSESHHSLLQELKVRGGASDESDYETADEDENDVDEEELDEQQDDDIEEPGGLQSESVVTGTLVGLSKRGLVFIGRTTLTITKATSRALLAAFQGDDEEEMEAEEDEEPPSLTTRFFRTIKRMWVAAWTPPEEDEESSELLAGTVKSKSKRMESSEGKEDLPSDFGTFLAKSYGVAGVDRGDAPVIGGTIGDALREARPKARLLVVFVPSERPGKKKNSPDQVAIRSLLSPEVAEVAEKRARKKGETGSYVIWGAKSSSPEAVTAIKRLKAKQPSKKGDKRPILVVAYPAQVLDSAGVPKLVPRLLAQHHCSPPPSEELMAAWLNALRKRHAKEYAAMQHDLKEAQLFKERKEGYKSSVISDVQRRQREQKEEEERLAKEEAEKARLEQLQKRRDKLRVSLPEEPDKDAVDSMTIALRFADGRTGQRRFARDSPFSTVFNWVDCTYEMERELVVLTTMNGQKSFNWDEDENLSLGDSGLGKMTGLRVSEKKKQVTEEVSADV